MISRISTISSFSVFRPQRFLLSRALTDRAGGSSGCSGSVTAVSRLGARGFRDELPNSSMFGKPTASIHSLSPAIPARREYRGRARSARITRADERWLLRSNDRAGRRSCCQGARRFRLPAMHPTSAFSAHRRGPARLPAPGPGSHIGVLGSWVISDGAKLVHLISPCPLPPR